MPKKKVRAAPYAKDDPRRVPVRPFGKKAKKQLAEAEPAPEPEPEPEPVE